MLIEIFKKGTYHFGERVVVITEKILKTIVRNYNKRVKKEENQKAPLVYGHPTNDAPAHGWVQRLQLSGGKIIADITNLSQKAMTDIRDGKYRNVSVAMNGTQLMHVGLLGATLPKVGGLNPIKFDAAGDGVVTYSIDTEEAKTLKDENAKLKKEIDEMKFREFSAEIKRLITEKKLGAETAKKIIEQSELLFTRTDYETALNTMKQISEFAAVKTESLMNELEIDEKAGGDGGTDDLTERTKLHNKVMKYAAEHKCTYEVALNIILNK
jgi:hypothetical protein